MLSACASSRRCPGCVGAFGTQNATCNTVADIRGAEAHALVRTGDGVALAWHEDHLKGGGSDIRFARLDAAGKRIGPVTLSPATAFAHSPSLVWVDTGFAVTWYESQAQGPQVIVFSLFDRDGRPLGSRTTLGPPCNVPADTVALTWTGRELGVLLVKAAGGGQDLWLLRFDSQGKRLAPDARVAGPWGNIRRPRLVWNGRDYAIAFTAESCAHFSRFDPATGHTTSWVHLDSIFDPDMVWTGDGYALAGTHPTQPEIRVTRLQADGTRIGSDVVVAKQSGPGGSPRVCMAWSGRTCAVLWNWYGDDIRVAVLDSKGAPLSVTTNLAQSVGSAYAGQVVWTGAGFAVAWQDTRYVESAIYLSQVDERGHRTGDERRMSDLQYPWNRDLERGPPAAGSVSCAGLAGGLCVGFRQYPTFAHGSSPILTARPAGFQMAWLDGTTVNVARLNVQGRMIGVPTKVPLPSVGEPRPGPSIAATADGFGILWSERDGDSDSHGLMFAKIDPVAARAGERQQVLKLPLRAPSSQLVATERGFAFAFIAGDGTRTGVSLAILDTDGKLLRVHSVATVEGTMGKVALVFARGVFVVAWSEDFLFGPSHRHEIRSIRLDAEGRPMTPVLTVATVAEMLEVTDLVVGRFDDNDSVAYDAAVAPDGSGIDGWHLVDLSRPGEEETYFQDIPDLVWTPERGVVGTSKFLVAFLSLASIRNLLAFKDGRGLVAWTPPNTGAIQVAPVCGGR